MWHKIKTVFSSVREYKVYALITPLFMAGEAFVECLLPFVMTIFTEQIEKMTSIVDLFPYLGGLLGLSIISITCGILGGRFASIASAGFAKNLRNDLYKKIESFSFENIDHFHSSSLVTRMTTDVNNAQQAFQMCTRIVIRCPLMLIFSAVMAFITGGNMAFIFVVAIPVISIGLFLVVKGAMSIFTKVFKRYDALNESVQENVTGIRVVKSYVREDFEINKFSTASNNMTKDFIKAEKLVALNGPIMNTSVHTVYIITLFLASNVIFNTVKILGDGKWDWGELSIPDMSALLTYGIQILMNLQMLSFILVMLVMSLEGVRRIYEVLEEEPTIKNCENPIYELEDGSVSFKNVNFKYSEKAERNALENINLEIKSGQFIGILGATGSGKTSLINLISRLYDISSGELEVGGHPVKEYDLKTLRDAVSVVLQKNYLFSGTVRSNMQWGNPNATDRQIKDAIKIAQAGEILTNGTGGLERVVDQGGANFSGGQKQRLCIARAILKEPKILILDDSTSAVDTKTDKLIRQSLKNDLPSMTKIIIAQRISSIEEADQIVIMDDGKIDAIGTHEELLKSNKIYQEVYYTQNKKGGNENA